MKAIQFGAYGEPVDVLSVADRPVPEPGPGEARVRILASPINPSDLLYVRGHYSGVEPRFPAPVGFEGVGIVDALGPEANGVAVGQRVAAINGQGGNWAEYAVLPASSLLPAPREIADEQVASFVINPASAILMVRHVLAVPPGEWLLQSAAGSELGRMIIRLAKRDGIRTVNVVRRRDPVAELEALGADAVIVSTEGPIDEQVHEIVGSQGVKYAIDPVVGQTGTEIFKALHEDGRMLVYGSLTGEPIRVGEDPRDILSGRRTVEVFWLGYWLPRLEQSGFYPAGVPAGVRLAKDIEALMRDEVLVTSPGRTYSLDEIGVAVAEAESVGRQGKVLLTPAAGVGSRAWTAAFANKSAEQFGAAFAEDVVLEAANLTRPVEGREQVMRVMATASQMYDMLMFTHEASSGPRTYVEWDATAFGDLELSGVTILIRDDHGQIVHVAIHHRPLGAALRFSAELRKRLTGVIDPGYFYEGEEDTIGHNGHDRAA